MKKLFSTLAAFCLGLLVSISIVACADDFGDQGGGNTEELQSLSELVAKLSEEVSNLKTTTQQQETKIAELTDKVALLNKKDLITELKETYQEDGQTYTDTVSFEYDSNGCITKIKYGSGYGYSSTDSVSYTDTGCIISSSGVTTKLTTTSNDIAAINRAIWSCYVDL